MKTLVLVLAAAAMGLPLAACSNKTVVHEQPGTNQQPVVRENNTIIKERSAPTVTEREIRY